MIEEDLIIKLKVRGELVSSNELTIEEIKEEVLDSLEVKSYNDKYTIYEVEKEIF